MSSDIPFYYRCETCSLQGNTTKGTPACAKFKIAINPEKDFCAWHQNKDIMGCIFCGTSDNLLIEEIDGENTLLCFDHYQALHSCQGCIKNNECAFANDHSEPQMVMKAMRQGGMIMQTQVKNPNLIKKHCLSCDCAYIIDGEPLCLKESPEFSCQNWKLQKTLLQQHYQ